jgi:ABC-type branched-subunit amino acid transport system substrate-binding protein
MRIKLGLIYTVLLICLAFKGVTQDTTSTRYQVAVFTPLFLDSAFDETTEYRYGKAFPKFINAGLEFYEGVELAIDSLNVEGIPLDIFVYDSKSAKNGINEVTKNSSFDSIDLIIGHVSAKEARMLSNVAAKKNIPFINATYPNDAGVRNNPNYIVLNSTLMTHFNAIYKYIQKNYALNPVVLFNKRGTQEETIKKYFEDITKNTGSVPLKIKYVTLPTNFTSNDVKQHLDEDAITVCIAGSFDVEFGRQLTSALSALYETAHSVVFAMPTWWEVADFTKPEYKSVEVFYSSPFYISATNPLAAKIEQDFKSKFYATPTDMLYRGFETLYHFAHLLQLNGKNIGSSLSDKRFRVFTDFDIQPVINPKNTTLDYFENKKIYFIKQVNGAEIAVY